MPLRPYTINYDKDNNFYYFETDQDVIYSCSFINLMSLLPPLLGIYDLEVRDFQFYPSDDKRYRDKRVPVTIMDLLENHFFTRPERVLTYSCDPTPNEVSGAARSKLFQSWAEGRSDVFDHYKAKATVESTGRIIHGGVITRTDFEHRGILRSELINKVPDIVREKYG